MPEQQDQVDAIGPAYQRQMKAWQLIEDLMGGTAAMRRAEQRWLPREPLESSREYEARLARTMLYNGLADAIQRVVSKPFTRPAAINGDLPERTAELEDDVDGTGRTFTSFAREWFDSGVRYGMSHCLVDFTRREGEEVPNAAEDTGRAKLIIVDPPRLLGFRADGDKLTEVRILEVRDEPSGTYTSRETKFVRVYRETEWELWRQDGKKWSMFDSGSHSFGAVPLVTFYTTPIAYLESKPPFEDLAWVNIAHWQSFSDQRHILRFARFGLLFAKGFGEDDLDPEGTGGNEHLDDEGRNTSGARSGIAVGPNKLITADSKDADLKYVEHSGAAIGAGEKDLERLEERMEVLGLQPMIRRTGGTTATARAIDEAKTTNDVQAWIRECEGGLRQVLDFAAQWYGEEVSDDTVVDIFNEFGISLTREVDAKTLLQLEAMGSITKKTMLLELKRRGVLSDELDIDAELENLEPEDTGVDEPEEVEV